MICKMLYLVAPCTIGSVDLIQYSGSVTTSTSGAVSVCFNSGSSSSNNYHLICDYGWDFTDAKVACVAAGYSPYGAVALHSMYLSSTAGDSSLAYMNCNGSETTLTECGLQITSWSCDYNYAGAQCQGLLWKHTHEEVIISTWCDCNRFDLVERERGGSKEMLTLKLTSYK